MLNSAWCSARAKVGLDCVRVHDLRHTYATQLRAAGVSLEDREDLLGHRSNRMTTHYSAAEVWKLEQAANTICERPKNRPELAVIKGARR
ncbi:MAG: tyrosine-type recombinase/integrase [Pseudomonadales bacterium]